MGFLRCHQLGECCFLNDLPRRLTNFLILRKFSNVVYADDVARNHKK